MEPIDTLILRKEYQNRYSPSSINNQKKKHTHTRMGGGAFDVCCKHGHKQIVILPIEAPIPVAI